MHNKPVLLKTVWALLTVMVAACAAAQQPETSPAGLWKTIDDHSGQPRGYVRIYEQGGAFFGKVEGIVKPEERHLKCVPCTDERKDQPVLGLVIIRQLREKGGEYTGGDILDPENGSVYRCRIRVADSGKRLVVRGYLGIPLFGRSQTWVREQ